MPDTPLQFLVAVHTTDPHGRTTEIVASYPTLPAAVAALDATADVAWDSLAIVTKPSCQRCTKRMFAVGQSAPRAHEREDA